MKCHSITNVHKVKVHLCTYHDQDIDECAEKTDNCDQFAICNNTVGSFTCYCPTGLTGDGLDCQGKFNLLKQE